MKRSLYPLIGLAVIVLDQLSKFAVRSNMRPGDRIPLIGDWLSFYYVQNTGTAFSMFEGNKLVTFVLATVLIVICIAFIISEIRAGRSLVPLLLSCVAAGGISNLIDRIALGFVTDMISCGSFAVFNVADIFVTCGCVILMIVLVSSYGDSREEGGSDEE